jgi:HEAT repeat protein
MPLLVRALGDADDAVKGAAAVAIGSTGGHGAVAIPGLVAARGTSVKYFDYLLDEAVFLIEHSGTWPPGPDPTFLSPGAK